MNWNSMKKEIRKWENGLRVKEVFMLSVVSFEGVDAVCCQGK